MLTYLKLSDNYLEIDLNVETVLRIRLNGDITMTTDDTKVEYVGTDLRLIVNKIDYRFEIRTDNIVFNVCYVDFPEAPEVLAEIMENYMTND
jgi:hypothetical protein